MLVTSLGQLGRPGAGWRGDRARSRWTLVGLTVVFRRDGVGDAEQPGVHAGIRRTELGDVGDGTVMVSLTMSSATSSPTRRVAAAPGINERI